MTIKNIIRSNRGAMFGLDARIALAIFTGLSVIAGAAIISAVSDTKKGALISEFDNISKGYLHYVIETGTDTATWSDLQSNYVTFTSDDHPTYGTLSLVEGKEDTTAVPPATCDGSNICAVWVKLTDVTTATVSETETAIDGAAGAANTGNFRFETDGDSDGDKDVYYKLSRKLTQ